jgi:hypothetical protein
MPDDSYRTTIAGVDADTPVLLVGDTRMQGRSVFVLFSDVERIVISRILDNARKRGDYMEIRDESRRLTDKAVVRLGGVLALLVALSSIASNVYIIVHGVH